MKVGVIIFLGGRKCVTKCWVAVVFKWEVGFDRSARKVRKSYKIKGCATDLRVWYNVLVIERKACG